MKYYYKFGNISFKRFEEIWTLYEKKSGWKAESFYKQAINSYGEDVYLIFCLYDKVDKFYKKEYIISGYCDINYIKNIEKATDNIVTILTGLSLREQLILDIKRIHNIDVS